MKLNHLNLTVSDVAETRAFLETYFGFKRMSEEGDEDFDVLFDDANLVLTLMRVGKAEVTYPPSFHIGFMQEGEEKVDATYQRLKDDGYDVKPPRHFHGAWTFYCKAPGGFTVEVLA